MRATKVQVRLTVPFIGAISGDWEPDEAERRAAWEIYVELVTRVTAVELKRDEGLLREALSSLYSLFGTTRAILRGYGPRIAPRRRAGKISLGSIAIAMLNGAIRPVLSRWHPLLADYEASRPSATPAMRHESAWEHADALRAELNTLRDLLIETARILGTVAGADDLLPFAVAEQPLPAPSRA